MKRQKIKEEIIKLIHEYEKELKSLIRKDYTLEIKFNLNKSIIEKHFNKENTKFIKDKNLKENIIEVIIKDLPKNIQDKHKVYILKSFLIQKSTLDNKIKTIKDNKIIIELEVK